MGAGVGEGLGVTVGLIGPGSLVGACVGCAVGTGVADGASVGTGRAVGVGTTMEVPEGVGVTGTGGVAVELSGRGRGVTQPSDRRTKMAATRAIAAIRPLSTRKGPAHSVLASGRSGRDITTGRFTDLSAARPAGRTCDVPLVALSMSQPSAPPRCAGPGSWR